MNTGSYVVHLIGSDDPPRFKHFRVRQDAVQYARSRVQIGDAERGDIYVIDAAAPAAAIAAVQMGAAELIESCTPHASEAEIEAATQRRWEEARKLGGEAMLKFLGLMENS